MPTYLYGLREDNPAVLMYTASQATLRPPGLPAVTLRQETDFPSSGTVILHVDPEQPAEFALHLRIPPYAAGAELRVGEDEPTAVPAGDFCLVERKWKRGDSVQLSLPFRLGCQANDRVLALTRGPLVYAYFQDAQADPVVFHHRRGRYPEDVVIAVDPDRLDPGVREEPAPEGLLGPALRLSGHTRAQAPIFAAGAANQALLAQEEQSFLLLPFANQGAIRGEYRVFVEYERPRAE
jgi:hypothetical protein